MLLAQLHILHLRRSFSNEDNQSVRDDCSLGRDIGLLLSDYGRAKLEFVAKFECVAKQSRNAEQVRDTVSDNDTNRVGDTEEKHRRSLVLQDEALLLREQALLQEGGPRLLHRPR